jgi:hypothetical protein
MKTFMLRFTQYLFWQSTRTCNGSGSGAGDAIKVYQIKNGPSPSTYIMRMACHQMMRKAELLQETETKPMILMHPRPWTFLVGSKLVGHTWMVDIPEWLIHSYFHSNCAQVTSKFIVSGISRVSYGARCDWYDWELSEEVRFLSVTWTRCIWEGLQRYSLTHTVNVYVPVCFALTCKFKSWSEGGPI